MSLMQQLTGRARHRFPGSRPAAHRGVAVTAVCAAAALAVAACGSSSGGSSASGKSSPITIGISVPLSGSVGSSCGPMDQGMLAWFNHVNATGGIHGQKIKVDNRDDAYQAAESVTNTRAFIAEHVVAVTGQCGSIQPPAQIPLLDAAKIPYLFVFGSCLPCNADPEYFNLMPDYGLQLQQMVPWVFQHKGKGSVVIMTSSTPGAAQITSNVESAVKQAGGSFLAGYNVPPGTADMTPYVLKMKNLHPDYVILNMTPQDAAVVTKAMGSQNFAPTKALVGSAAISQATFLTNVPPSLLPKVIVSSDVIPPASAGGTQCSKVLTAAKIEVSSVTLRGCGTAQVDTAVMMQAGSPVTSAGIVKALEGWKKKKVSEIYPALTFSQSNHVGVSALYLFGVKNNQFVVIGQL